MKYSCKTLGSILARLWCIYNNIENTQLQNHTQLISCIFLMRAKVLWISSKLLRMRAIAYEPFLKLWMAYPMNLFDRSFVLLSTRLLLSSSSTLNWVRLTLYFGFGWWFCSLLLPIIICSFMDINHWLIFNGKYSLCLLGWVLKTVWLYAI